jgi:adenylate cyclase
MKHRRFRWVYLLPLLPVLLGLNLMVFDTRLQQAMRNSMFDQYQRWHPRPYLEVPVRIVDVDEASLQRLGQWPWPRSKIAELLNSLGAAGAAVVGFDVLFSEPDRTSPEMASQSWELDPVTRARLKALPDHDAVFAKSLERTPAVLGFALEQRAGHADERAPSTLPVQQARFIYVGANQNNWLHGYGRAVTALPALEASAAGNGAITFVPDADGVVRRVPLVLRINNKLVGTLTGESLRVALGTRNVMLKSSEQNNGLVEVRIGDVNIPTNARGEMWVHYSRAVPQRTVSAWRVLAGEVPPEQLSGHIVLIGSSAQGLMDLRFNPFGVMPGVQAHAQALEQALSGHFLVRPSWARGLEALTLTLGSLLIGWLTMRLSALKAASVWCLMLGGIFASSWWSFLQQGLLVDGVTPAIGISLAFIFSSLWHHFASEREQAWIKDAFSRYVSPNRVAHLVNHPEALALGGERKTCSFIFTDLESFTGLMESRDPSDAVALLNDYLDHMIAIIFEHDGTLDRIVGDALAVVFSAPVTQDDHLARAVRCALALDTFANQYSQAQKAKGVAFGKTRIGVHSGDVLVGNFGGSNMFDYRALGDAVNTSARLESVNKHLGTRICFSEAMLDGAQDVPLRPIGQLVLVGKKKALKVFEPLVQEGYERADSELYAQAYASMAHGEARALEMFGALTQRWPDDPLVSLHLKRLQGGERSDLIVMDAK